ASLGRALLAVPPAFAPLVPAATALALAFAPGLRLGAGPARALFLPLPFALPAAFASRFVAALVPPRLVAARLGAAPLFAACFVAPRLLAPGRRRRLLGCVLTGRGEQ